MRVKDRHGLAALGRMDEPGICDAHMAGSLDIAGDMLGFVSLRGSLSDRHLLHSLWRRTKPTFVFRYIFPGDPSYFCLHEYLAAVAKTQMEVLAVHHDRHNYFLTCTAWAEKLETARDEIISRWGEALYRRFRLYLWGSALAFLTRGMDAYRVVLERW